MEALHPFQDCISIPHQGVCCQEIPQFGQRKCQKEWNRWFKRQLAKRTAADLLNSVVTWSRDDQQLILPNYSDMSTECRRQCVHSRFCCRKHFGTRASEEHVPDGETFQTRGHAAARGEGWRGDQGSALAFIPFPEALCRAFDLQQCRSHLWVLSAEAS